MRRGSPGAAPNPGTARTLKPAMLTLTATLAATLAATVAAPMTPTWAGSEDELASYQDGTDYGAARENADADRRPHAEAAMLPHAIPGEACLDAMRDFRAAESAGIALAIAYERAVLAAAVGTADWSMAAEAAEASMHVNGAHGLRDQTYRRATRACRDTRWAFAVH